jgi:hypothetical protein
MSDPPKPSGEMLTNLHVFTTFSKSKTPPDKNLRAIAFLQNDYLLYTGEFLKFTISP